MKSAFSMIELVFVIVIIGILAAIAIPKFNVTRDDAHIAKARSTVASIRSALMTERTKRVMRGDPQFPAALDDAPTLTPGAELFDGNSTVDMLTYPVYAAARKGGWIKTGNTTYEYYIQDNGVVIFTYDNNNGTFDCNRSFQGCAANFNF